MANLRIFFEIWLQQFLSIFDVSLSGACKNKKREQNQLTLSVFEVGCSCMCGCVFFLFFFAYLVWNSWRCDNRAAACYIGKTWTCFLQSPPEAAEGQTPAWTQTHTHTQAQNTLMYFWEISCTGKPQKPETHYGIYFLNSVCAEGAASVCLPEYFRASSLSRDRSQIGLCAKYAST